MPKAGSQERLARGGGPQPVPLVGLEGLGLLLHGGPGNNTPPPEECPHWARPPSGTPGSVAEGVAPRKGTENGRARPWPQGTGALPPGAHTSSHTPILLSTALGNPRHNPSLLCSLRGGVDCSPPQHSPFTDERDAAMRRAPPPSLPCLPAVCLLGHLSGSSRGWERKLHFLPRWGQGCQPPGGPGDLPPS
ncbi:UNVERIFIED_CONTAM: hypothetical protein K2H54_073829 [Gekko kuhli]